MKLVVYTNSTDLIIPTPLGFPEQNITGVIHMNKNTFCSHCSECSAFNILKLKLKIKLTSKNYTTNYL